MRLQWVALASLLLVCCSAPKTPTAPVDPAAPLPFPSPGAFVGDPSLPYLVSAASYATRTIPGTERCRSVLVDLAVLRQWGESPGSVVNAELFDGNTVVLVSEGHLISDPRAYSGFIRGEPYGTAFLFQPTATEQGLSGRIQAAHLYPFDLHSLFPNLAGGSLLCQSDSRKSLPI